MTFSKDDFRAVKPTTDGRLQAIEMTLVQRGPRLAAVEKALEAKVDLRDFAHLAAKQQNDIDRINEAIIAIRAEYARKSVFDRAEDARKSQVNLEAQAKEADRMAKEKRDDKRSARLFAVVMAVISFALSLASLIIGKNL